MHAGLLLAAELDSVTDEVLKELFELLGVAQDRRKRIPSYHRAAFCSRHRQIVHRFIDDCITVCWPKGAAMGADLRQGEQPVHQVAHP